MKIPMILLTISICFGATAAYAAEPPDMPEVTHHYAQNGDIRLHYVSAGEGPLVLMLHGFPDYWYTWRHQIAALSQSHRVVAMDLRGYNLSDQPEEVSDYVMMELISDVVAVLNDVGEESAIIVGNDWGAAIAWLLTAFEPSRVDGLVALNLPHPACFARELRENPAQQEASAYARRFREEDGESALTPEKLTEMVAGSRSDEVQAKYLEAMERSSITAMLNYYKASFPKPQGSDAPPSVVIPKIVVPVLVIHGLEDPALLPAGLNDTWEQMDAELSIVTLPNAGHFVQQDAPHRVNRLIQDWIKRLDESD